MKKRPGNNNEFNKELQDAYNRINQTMLISSNQLQYNKAINTMQTTTGIGTMTYPVNTSHEELLAQLRDQVRRELLQEEQKQGIAHRLVRGHPHPDDNIAWLKARTDEVINLINWAA